MNLCTIDSANNETKSDNTLKVLEAVISDECPASFIQSFKNNFPALEALNLDYKIKQTQTEYESTLWWNQLTDVCQGLQDYQITITSPKHEDYSIQLENYANFLKKIIGTNVNRYEGKTSIRLEITDNWTLEVEHNGSKLQLVGLDFLESSIYGEDLVKQVFEKVLRPFSLKCLDIVYKEKKREYTIFEKIRQVFKTRKEPLILATIKVHLRMGNDHCFTSASSVESYSNTEGYYGHWSFE
ncbi:hypothetical protein BD408DRAFT_448548 [Parasitella parasitica]|nr:hypothetical protein BD408DRAFT_448548 [Parasitella parasitica]